VFFPWETVFFLLKNCVFVCDFYFPSTYAWRGEKTVFLIKTNGFRKRITVCLAVLSNGDKIPPFVIFSGQKPPINPYSNRIVVTANKDAWITEEPIGKW